MVSPPPCDYKKLYLLTIRGCFAAFHLQAAPKETVSVPKILLLYACDKAYPMGSKSGLTH